MIKKNYKLIIFDLDGTIANTSQGIVTCYKYTINKMINLEPTSEELKSIIGIPLIKTFMTKFNFSKNDAIKATTIYRKKYAEKGIYEVKLYNGLKEVLIELKKRGYRLAVATLKADNLAKSLLKNLNISKYFDVIHGVDDKDSLSKSDLIDMCKNDLNINSKETILVGDSISDKNGANLSKVDFIAAKYGFGFKLKEEQEALANTTTISEPLELLNILP